MDKTDKYKKSGDVVHREIAGESILVPIRGNVADMQRLFALEGVGAFIWGKLDGETAVAEIAALVADRFDVDLETAEKDVAVFIDELLKNELIST